MKNIVFDSYAIICHFKKEKGHEEVSEELSEIAIGNKAGFISLINVGEVYYILHRTYGLKIAEESVKIIHQLPLQIITPDLEQTISSARFKANNKMSYADAFAAALTKMKNAVLITGDKEFKAVQKDIKIRFI
ncbi:MAG: type II toxin-antitoxin system VapC family toxin [Ignavibacteria bacterium]